jgi:Chaperone of endosialidase
MPWELTGNPDADINPNDPNNDPSASWLGTVGRQDPLRIRTGTNSLFDFTNPNQPDTVHIQPARPDTDELGYVGIWTNTPQETLHVAGSLRVDATMRLPGGVWQGTDLTVRVAPVNPVPGELVLGGIRTSVSGFDGPPDEPPSWLVPGGLVTAQQGLHRGNHFIRTNGSENELWMGFKRAHGPATGPLLLRSLQAAVSWFGPGFNKNSDARLKTNVRPVEGALEKLERIRGVTYEAAETESPYALAGLPGQPSIGVVAQEVEEVFPEVVSIYDPEQEYKAVDYDGLTSVLIEAVKELKAQNEELQSRIEALERA